MERRTLNDMPCTLQVGKNGLGEAQIAELHKQLKKRKTVKVKILRPALADRETLIDRMLAETGAELRKRIGNVIILEKK